MKSCKMSSSALSRWAADWVGLSDDLIGSEVAENGGRWYLIPRNGACNAMHCCQIPHPVLCCLAYCSLPLIWFASTGALDVSMRQNRTKLFFYFLLSLHCSAKQSLRINAIVHATHATNNKHKPKQTGQQSDKWKYFPMLETSRIPLPGWTFHL